MDYIEWNISFKDFTSLQQESVKKDSLCVIVANADILKIDKKNIQKSWFKSPGSKSEALAKRYCHQYSNSQFHLYF